MIEPELPLKDDLTVGTQDEVPSGIVQKSKRSVFLPLFFLLLVFSALGGGAIFYSFVAPLQLPIDSSLNVIVPKGAGVQDVAQILFDKNVISHKWSFRFAALFIARNRLRAGEYKFSGDKTMAEIVVMMRHGDFVVRRLTIPEGMTSFDIQSFLNREETLSGDSILEVPDEGSLLPETYHYSYGDDRAGIVARMKKARNELLDRLWAERDTALPLASKDEAVVLASLIEKETGKKGEERARVAGVFYNRLQVGMRLQSDPTVIYGLTLGKQALGRSLTRADLEAPSPYNTYVNTGVPPKPICNPGRASIEAALKPEKNDFFYFVADGSGGHAFSKNLDQHNKNVRDWVKTLRIGK